MSSETNLVVIHLLFVYETMTSFSKSRTPCFHVEYFILTNILFFFFEIAMIFKLFALKNETFSNYLLLTIFEFQTTMAKGARYLGWV